MLHPSCMYACMYVCMSVCLYACMYVCIYVCMSVCLYVCMYVCMYECMNVCRHACVCVTPERRAGAQTVDATPPPKAAPGDADVTGQAVAAASAAGEAFGPEQTTHDSRGRERQPHGRIEGVSGSPRPSWRKESAPVTRGYPSSKVPATCSSMWLPRAGKHPRRPRPVPGSQLGETDASHRSLREGRPTVEVGLPSASASRKRPAPDAPAAECRAKKKRGAFCETAREAGQRRGRHKLQGIWDHGRSPRTRRLFPPGRPRELACKSRTRLRG